MACCSSAAIRMSFSRSSASPSWLSRWGSSVSKAEINTAPVRWTSAKVAAMLSKFSPIFGNWMDCASSDSAVRRTSVEPLIG